MERWGGLSSTSPAASPSCRFRDGGFRETVIKSSGGEDVSLRRKHRQATQSGYESVPELVLNLPSGNCRPLESPPSVFFPQPQGYLQCHSGWQLNLQVCDLRANGFIPGGGCLISRTEVGWLELLCVWSPWTIRKDNPIQAEICKGSNTDPTPGKQNLFLSKGRSTF